MFKKITILLLILLTGCQNKKETACMLSNQDSQISIDIKAINDDITSINVREFFIIPSNVISNPEFFNDLNSQINYYYHFEDNLLVKEYEVELDDTYSYSKTLEYLRNKRYFCE